MERPREADISARERELCVQKKVDWERKLTFACKNRKEKYGNMPRHTADGSGKSPSKEEDREKCGDISKIKISHAGV